MSFNQVQHKNVVNMTTVLMKEIKVMQRSIDIIDPHVCSDSKDRNSVLFSICEPLVKRSGRQFEPCLAESWKADNEAREWVFRIRDKARFHDERQATSEDFIITMERALDPALGGAYGTQGVYRSYLGDSSFQILDRHRIKISLPHPMADLLDILSEIPVVSKDSIGDLPDTLSGSGPYYVTDKDPRHIKLKRFEDHWGHLGNYEKATFLCEPTEENRVEALERGEADIISGLSPQGALYFRDNLNVQVKTSESALCIIYLCNALKGPCVDHRVRKALNCALDVPTIIRDVKKGEAWQLSGPLTASHYGFDPEAPPYINETDKARQLLKDAGCADTEIKVDTPFTMPDEALELTRIIGSQLEKVGINVEIRVHEDREKYAQMVRNKEIGDLCCFDSSPLSALRVYREKIHSGYKGPWWQGYTNKVVDSLIDRTQGILDINRREAIYKKIFRILNDEAPWLFLYTPKSLFGVSRRKAMKWSPDQYGLIKLIETV